VGIAAEAAVTASDSGRRIEGPGGGTSLNEKYGRLLRILRSFDRGAVVAFSGGVDSTLLLVAAAEALPGRVVAALARSPSLPSRDLADAFSVAERLGIELVEVETCEIEDPAYSANPPDRCYHCKRHLFSSLIRLAGERGYGQVVEGSNLDDSDDYRPGRRAIGELAVRSPLSEAGLTKADIRELLRSRGFPAWEKPAQACLASRVPYGQEITAGRLARIDAAEQSLRSLGFRCVRVRDFGHLAVVEVGPDELELLFANSARAEVLRRLTAAGWRSVALDARGYRTGSLNAGLPAAPHDDP